jgi:hypothetical protein
MRGMVSHPTSISGAPSSTSPTFHTRCVTDIDEDDVEEYLRVRELAPPRWSGWVLLRGETRRPADLIRRTR